MVAGDVGEGAGREPDAVEPILREPVARGFERQMRHVIGGELAPASRAASPDRASYARDTPTVRPDDADRAEARGAKAHRLPDLAHEGGDRGLAVGAGDRDHEVGLSAGEARRHAGEQPIADCRHWISRGTPSAPQLSSRWQDRRGARRRPPAE